MNTNVSIDITGGRCALNGVLDFNTTRLALENVRPVIEQQAKVEIDFSSVSSANSAGLALLIECQALAHLHQHQVQFSHIPEGLLQLAAVCEVKGLI
ncbi:MAG: STAS domain-containing protein [Granulosicoccaceae bacterium]